MIHSDETGICEYVTYERYCEDIQNKNKQIEEKDMRIEDLENELQEHKQLITELKKSYEEVMCEKENRSYLK